MLENLLVILSVAVLVSLDNLRLSFGLGTLELNQKQRRILPISFAFFEGSMPMIGVFIGIAVLEPLAAGFEKVEVVLLMGTGLLILLGSLYQKQFIERLLGYRWVLVGLPFLLSLDNLLAGVTISAGNVNVHSALFSAMLVGLVSGLAAGAGIGLGRLLRRWAPQKASIVGGSVLLVLGVMSLVS